MKSLFRPIREWSGRSALRFSARANSKAHTLPRLDPCRFLEARVQQKDTFVCRSNNGCGGAGNRCRIERLRTLTGNQPANFTWGGACALHDKATRKKKLPDLAPDPFREREEQLQKLLEPFRIIRGKPRVAIADEFMLKGLFPFFAAFFHSAGFDLEIAAGADAATLKRGIQLATVPFCAPMQLYHGIAERMIATGADWIFAPMIRSVPRAEGQRSSVVCPIVQAGPDLLRWAVSRGNARGNGTDSGSKIPRWLSPVIDFDAGNFESKEFLASCQRLAGELGLSSRQWRHAWTQGAAAQREFDLGGLAIGRRALEFSAARGIVPVIVLGRAYTIYNRVLNSNVPAILREQGAIGIPVDCYPLDAGAPLFSDMYWGYGHNVLRAAHQIRRERGVYALYCSNYSCGPDSFNLHFAAYAMAGKPFAIIETDGHSGDAGTRTRVEAFLHCVDEDRRVSDAGACLNDFGLVQSRPLPMRAVRASNGPKERLLIPYFGPLSDVVSAVFRGIGMEVETLRAPDADSLRLGRRYTSGKECLPLPMTLGTLLQRLNQTKADERFVYLIASTDGPCRFGVYNLLNRIVLDHLGWRDRLRIWAPTSMGYFDGTPAGTQILVCTGMIATDLLFQAKLDVRPVERVRGETEKLYQKSHRELLARLESAARESYSAGPALWQVLSGRLFGVRDLLREAGKEFARLRGSTELPVVELSGEIYLRSVEFSNDFLIEQLEARGLRLHLSPKSEWIDYCNECRKTRPHRNRAADNVSDWLQHRIQTVAFSAIAPSLAWPPLPSTRDALFAAAPYINEALQGEAVLTVGIPLHEWRHGTIDGVVSVGPLECMPTKIAEAQMHHVAEREGLLSLTLSFNGDPISATMLDNFAYEVKSRFAQRRQTRQPAQGRHPVAAEVTRL